MILGKENVAKFFLKINLKETKPKDDILLLGITIDKKLNIKKHNGKLHCTASYKLHALISLQKYLTLQKAGILGSTT